MVAPATRRGDLFQQLLLASVITLLMYRGYRDCPWRESQSMNPLEEGNHRADYTSVQVYKADIVYHVCCGVDLIRWKVWLGQRIDRICSGIGDVNDARRRSRTGRGGGGEDRIVHFDRTSRKCQRNPEHRIRGAFSSHYVQ